MQKILRILNYSNECFLYLKWSGPTLWNRDRLLFDTMLRGNERCVVWRGFYAILLLLSTAVSPMLSQILLDREDYLAGSYRMSFSNHGYAYTIREENNQRIIRFNVPYDEGREASPILPRKDLFIALPPNTRSPIKFVVVKQDAILNVLPALTPNIHQANDSLISYTAAAGMPSKEMINTVYFKFNGFLWIGGNYCAHVTIFPYLYDEQQHKLSVLEEFHIDAEVPALPVRSDSQAGSGKVDELIVNPDYATAWRSARPGIRVAQTDSWIDYTQEYLKIGVAADDIYRLSYSDLLKYGVPVGSINPRSLKLYLKGKEVPVFVFGESDNVFNPGDYIEFLGRRNYGDPKYREVAEFGTPYHEFLSPYSDTTIYWLNWSGGPGKRVDTIVAVTGAPTDTTKYYDELIHKEINNYWDFSLTGGDVRKNSPDILENETWNEGNLGVGTLSIPFTVDNLYPNKPARAFVKLQDYSSNIDLNAHNLSLSINANPTRYDSGYINKYQVKTLTASFSSTLLTNGSNNVNIQSYPTQNTINAVIRDWYELEYPRSLTTNLDSLTFAYRNLSGMSTSVFRITGITSSPYSLYRFVGKDSTVVKITNYVRSNGSLQFTDTLAAGRTYFLIGENKTKTPIVFFKKKFINLRNPSTQADYLAITHPYFSSAAANYISFISATYKVTTKLINVNDIYDEFNYGFLAPECIKDFLQATHQVWQTPAPQFVFLIGKGTYDFYGNKTRYFAAPAIMNFVPPYGNPVSDVWFTIWDSTGAMVPQMDIGRIPAKNMDEFQSYFTKHQKYVTKGYDDWNKRYLFFSGGNFTEPDQLAQSKFVNDAIINNYVTKSPIGGLIANFYKTANPVSNFGPYTPEYIKNAIDQGGLFISYIGHSGTQTWDNSITDVGQLANIRDRNPLITDFGCSTGKFAEPDVLSFSELATNDLKGQAIAYIGNSSLGFTTTAYTFPQVFYKKLLIDTLVSIGETHRLAKTDFVGQYGTSSVFALFVLTNTLLGDPIVKLPIPPKPNLSLANTSVAITPSRPTEETDTLRVDFSYNNYGKVTGDSIDVKITDEYLSHVIYSKIVTRKIPLYVDSLSLSIPIHAMPGEHKLSIAIDPLNRIDEIAKNDNLLTSTIVVASSNTRNLSITPIANQTTGELTFLNPSVKTADTQFIVEVSLNSAFSPRQEYTIPFDTFYTKFTVDPSLSGKRFWTKTRNAALNVEGLTYSYFYGNKANYFVNDSNTFSRIASKNIALLSNRIMLDTAKISFSAISAGFSDGRTAVIMKNGQNFIPENTLRGHHVVLFDASTFENTGYYRFDVLGSASEVTRYNALLDTLTSKFIIIIAVSDEGGSNLDAHLKSNIKLLGSRYIDSVGFRYSWAIIGRKGSAPGSVPENFSAPFAGRVQIDTTISIPNTTGTFETEAIGPVAAWKNSEIHYSTTAGGTIKMSIVGITSTNSQDTVKSVFLSDSAIDLSTVNAQRYPAIKVVGEITRAPGQLSPSVSSIAVNYDQLAELGTNYQAVRAFIGDHGTPGRDVAAGDTVIQGEKIALTYRVYNAGGTTAKKIGVQASAVWDNNNTESISSSVIDSLAPRSYKEFSAVYNTALGYGRRSLRITIDPDTLIRELFKDNNIYALPVFVKKDSSKPLLPNLAITSKNIYPIVSPVTDEIDSARFAIVYGNSGAFINDSVSIAVRQFYNGTNVASWTIRRKYPPELDTVYLSIPILKRAGEHQLQVELDPFGVIVESSKTDNIATLYFTVATTDFKILQPTSFSTGAFASVIFLNPTSTAGGAARIADFELDTLDTYATSRKAQLPMNEFTTSYDIGSVPKPARYYWRIRQQQSGRDWTAGSFYLGDASVYTIGQRDSAGWKENAYLHATYTASGAKISDTRTAIKALSAGFSDGRTGSIEINGINVISPVFGTGHNCAVIDTISYAVTARKRFDISNNADEADSLTQFLLSVPSGYIVADVVVDDGANNLQQSTRDALKSIGSASIDKLTRRDSWAIIGRKGAPKGSVPEAYVPQFGGSASVETTLVKKEFKGTVATQPFGPLSNVSAFSITGVIPGGTSVQTLFIGTRYTNVRDTVLLTSGNTLSNTHIQNSAAYKEGMIIFTLQTSGPSSPSITGWTLSATPSTELAASARTAVVTPSQVIEGEPVVFTGKIFNVCSVPADSATVQLSINEGGFDRILKTQQYPVISGNDSVGFTYTYSSRGKSGNFAFTLKIDPLNALIEESKDNNSVSIPFLVQSDSLRPALLVDIDGVRVVDGDYVSQHPVVRIAYSDNNPSVITRADSSNFRIRLNNAPVYFTPGVVEMLPSSTPGAVQLNWTPELPNGENLLQISATDVAGNASDTTLLFVNVSSNFMLGDVYNLPNPFAGSTHFTFNVLGPVNPDAVTIKIFTVAGRLIQDIPYSCKIGFNKIYWDGRDRDGDEIANGVYFYKIIVTQGDKQTTAIAKLVKMK
jgi:hypothetical protein